VGNNNKIDSLDDVYKWLKKMCDKAGFGIFNIWSFFKSDAKGMKGLRTVCDKYGLNRKDLNPDSIINYARLKLAIPEIEQCIDNTKYGRTHKSKFKTEWAALKSVVDNKRPYGPTPERGIVEISAGYSYDGQKKGSELQIGMQNMSSAVGHCAYDNGDKDLNEGIKTYHASRNGVMTEVKEIFERGKLYYVWPKIEKYGPIITQLNKTIDCLYKIDPILTTDQKTDLIISLETLKSCIEKEQVKIIFSYKSE